LSLDEHEAKIEALGTAGRFVSVIPNFFNRVIAKKLQARITMGTRQ
jgi:hypothetical protein